ncbi:MAG: hypothetical protein ACFFE5_02940 [Candidatus Thorarchaeota archaeon]
MKFVGLLQLKWKNLILHYVTGQESYYDWELKVRNKPSYIKKYKKNKKQKNDLGISVEDFRKYIKLWKSKNIVF